MKALIVNRIGDFGLSLGIFAIFFVFGAVDYSTVFSTVTDLAYSTYSSNFSGQQGTPDGGFIIATSEMP